VLHFSGVSECHRMHVKEPNPELVIFAALVMLCISIMQLRFAETQIDPPCRIETRLDATRHFQKHFDLC
jgi:hypothetical protein